MEAKFCNLSLSSNSVSIFQWCDYGCPCNTVIPENAKFSLQSGSGASRHLRQFFPQVAAMATSGIRGREIRAMIKECVSMLFSWQHILLFTLLAKAVLGGASCQAYLTLLGLCWSRFFRIVCSTSQASPPPSLPAPQSCIIALAFLGHYLLLKSHWQLGKSHRVNRFVISLFEHEVGPRSLPVTLT